MTERPANVVEGIGHGIIAMAEGVFTGITDVVTKPVEGTKKEGAKGFIKGLFKGVGGLLTKPIVGGLEFVSRASEGLKNSIVDDKLLMTQERKPRAFYGKFKSVK
jgi:vacuolar protein sorting-associated protein 13A/C